MTQERTAFEVHCILCGEIEKACGKRAERLNKMWESGEITAQCRVCGNTDHRALEKRVYTENVLTTNELLVIFGILLVIIVVLLLLIVGM